MSYGPLKVFTGTIASGASTLTQVALDKAYSKLYAEISTMSTNTVLTVYASTDGATFRPVMERVVATAPVQYQTLTVLTAAVGAGGGCVPLDVVYPYVQFRGAETITGGCTIKIIGVD